MPRACAATAGRDRVAGTTRERLAVSILRACSSTVVKRGNEFPRDAHARVDARIRLGAQGWLYKDWLGAFYPPGTDNRNMLAEYGRVFSTVEVDSSYYATPPASSVEGWRARTPDGFQFSLKVPSE